MIIIKTIRRNDKKAITVQVLSVIIVVIGIALLLFPNIANKIYVGEKDKLKDTFENKEISNPGDALYEELERRNENLYTYKQDNLVDPFSYQQPNIDLSYFGIENNIIGFLRIPRMNVELPIYLGANTANLDKGAAHLTETSYPIGGVNTNAVIAAHRGGRNADMFRNIEDLRIGDKIYIKNFREELVYQVILPVDMYELLIQKDRDLVTLVTCHPLGQNSHRYVVFCERVIEN